MLGRYINHMDMHMIFMSPVPCCDSSMRHSVGSRPARIALEGCDFKPQWTLPCDELIVHGYAQTDFEWKLHCHASFMGHTADGRPASAAVSEGRTSEQQCTLPYIKHDITSACADFFGDLTPHCCGSSLGHLAECIVV